MQRREFITFLGGAVAMRPFAADAQRRTARIGFFTPQSPNPPGSRPFEMACASEHILKDKNPDLARVDSSKRINYLLTTFPQSMDVFVIGVISLRAQPKVEETVQWLKIRKIHS
jgi:hypothetical protein